MVSASELRSSRGIASRLTRKREIPESFKNISSNLQKENLTQEQISDLQAREEALKLYLDKVSWYWVENDRVKRHLKNLYQQSQIERKSDEQILRDYQSLINRGFSPEFSQKAIGIEITQQEIPKVSEEVQPELYQGPVKLGYREQDFRTTGKSIQYTRDEIKKTGEVSAYNPSFSLNPSSMFFRNKLDQFKKIEAKSVQSADDYYKNVKAKSYSQLFKQGELPSVVYKGTLDFGKGAVATGITTLGFLSNLRPYKTTTDIKASYEKGKSLFYSPLGEKLSRFVGETALLSLFTPTKASAQRLESEYVQDVSTGAFVKKSDLAEYLRQKFAGLKGIKEKEKALTTILKKPGVQEDAVLTFTQRLRDSGLLPKDSLTIIQNGKVSIIPQTNSFKGGNIFFKTNVPTAELKGSGVLTSTIQQASSSVFSGTGQYEKTSEVMGRTAQNQRSSLISASGQYNILENKPLIKSSQLLSPSTIEISKTKQGSLISPMLKSNLKVNQANVMDTQTRQELKLIPALRFGLSSGQTNKYKSAFESLPKLKEKEKSLPKPVLQSSFFKKLKGSLTPSSTGQSFEVFGKRFGKDIKLGTFSDKGKAKEKLVSFLTGTLGRSGKITQNNKALSFSELDLNKMFRPSKRDSSRVVQEAKYSLGSMGERSEINLFRKSKKSKSKNLFFK